MYSVNVMTGYLCVIDDHGDEYCFELGKVHDLSLTDNTRYYYGRHDLQFRMPGGRMINLLADVETVSIATKKDPDFSGIEELL